MVRPHFRPEIEGLRAIAVLVVVAYHARVPGFGGGFVGVDVFFVVSGFLITWLLAYEAESTGQIDLVRFYGRRARRLLPALALLLVVVVPAMAMLYAPFEQRALAATALATASYGSNIYFALDATDYLGSAADENPLLHTWSLGVEEQFYLVWPLLVAVSLGVWRASRSYRGARLVTAVASLGLASFFLGLWMTHWRQPWAFFLSPARAWEFAVGGLGATLSFGNRARASATGRSRSLLAEGFGIGGLVGIAISVVAIDEATAFPGLAALLPVLSTAAVLTAAALHPSARFAGALSARPLQHLGRLSYSWYLWHWPVLVFAGLLFRQPSLRLRVGVVLVSLVLSEVSYRWVEQPWRTSRYLRSGRLRSLAMAGMVTATCLLLGFVWLLLSARWASLPEQAAFTMARRARPSYFAAGCNADFYSLRTDTKACSFGSDAPEDPRVVLLGDSHAAQWYPAVERLSTERSWRLWPMTKSSCAPLPVLQFNPRLGREYRECATWLENALSSIEEIEPDLVLVTWSMRHALSRRQWTEGVEGLIARLAPAGDHIAVLEDTPWPAFDIPKCLARRTWRPNLVGGDSCQFEPVQGNRERAFDGVRAVAARVRNVSMIDMNGVICPATPCPPDRHGEPIYRDTHHLAPGFVVDLAEALARELDQTRSLPKIGTGATTSQ